MITLQKLFYWLYLKSWGIQPYLSIKNCTIIPDWDFEPITIEWNIKTVFQNIRFMDWKSKKKK